MDLPDPGSAGRRTEQPDPTVSVDDRDTLDRAILRLTPQHRAVFVLHHHAGLPVTEIADIVGVPVGTVKSRRHHATRSLRAAIVADSQVDSTEARPA
jgi:RNA polymerase sigma-70 factor (ECF subfamily)